MIFTTAAAGKFVAQKVLGAGADATKTSLFGFYERWRERRELARICQAALASAATTAPQLQSDFCSDSFLDGVILPIVRKSLADPSVILAVETLVERYLDMFVARFANGDLDAALQRIFFTDRDALAAALRAFLTQLKSGLYQSKYWAERQGRATLEAAFEQIAIVRALVEDGIGDGRPRRIDLAGAKRNAEAASSDMRAWPSTILGRVIETPGLDRVFANIEANPNATALLVGEAGSGKSALFARLIPLLAAKGITPIAIKADQLPADVETIDDIARALGVAEGMGGWIATLASAGPIALLVDQLDAVSTIMDRQSQRMTLLLRLIRNVAELRREGVSIYVLASSRPFEAAHDARFAQLKAEEIRLDLLDETKVTAFLTEVGIAVGDLDKTMLQTLRRPFALKLFAEIANRGGDVGSIGPGELLDTWLAIANLGLGDDRLQAMGFMTALAEEMVETETLWRPVDRFDRDFHEAVRRCEACGLILRDNDRIGFSHQSWLDDFQAKLFRSGKQFADYARERQDSLFVRASILRGLERLRAADEPAYEAACRQLLRGSNTRRHVLHLIADIIATAAKPLSAEAAWVERWIAHDLPLARRALSKIVDRWVGWRNALKPSLPDIMAQPDLLWLAARLLAAELAFDPEGVADLIDRWWGGPERDVSVFTLIDHAEALTPRLRDRLGVMFGRSDIADHSVAHLVGELRKKGAVDQAINVVVLWLPSQKPDTNSPPSLYDLEALAEAAPLAFFRAVLPWMVALGQAGLESLRDILVEYPRSRAYAARRMSVRKEGSIFDAIDIALDRAAVAEPQALWELLAPLTSIEVDEVQEIVVKGLSAAGDGLRAEAVAYMLGDPRRFAVSDVVGSEGGRVITSVKGWHVQRLLAAISGGLSDAELGQVRDAIEAWTVYTPEALKEGGRQYFRWADEARLPLLAALPSRVLEPRRRRQVAEWRDASPTFEPDLDGDGLAGWVGPAMTHEEMAKADDRAILNLLNQITDDTPEDFWERPISRAGGIRALSQAFGAFGKAEPARAIRFALDHFKKGQQEVVAAALVRDISGEASIEPATVRDLILTLCARGFDSDEWRQEAARALGRVAARLGGLDDHIVAMLLAWVNRDPESIAQQVGERLEFEQGNPREKSKDKDPHPILFGRISGGEFLPSHNFTILSAVASCLLQRKPAAVDQWLDILEAHLAEPEDPAIWLGLLQWHRWALHNGDAPRVTALVDAVLDTYPEMFVDLRVIHFLWPLRARMSDPVLMAVILVWLGAGDVALQQAAAEFAVAAHLVEPAIERYQRLYAAIDWTKEAVAVGGLFAAASAWRQKDETLRLPAQEILLRAVPTAIGPVAHAVSTAVDTGRKLLPDEATKALLAAIMASEDVLEASINGYFVESLQELLLHPGFDETVLEVSGRIADLIVRKGQNYRFGMVGRDLVQIAVALQRNDGALRTRAMDLYEALLDAEIYGAEQAAKDSLGR